MPLKEIIQKRDKLRDSSNSSSTTAPPPPPSDIPEIKFIRSDTTTQEVINPPIYDSESDLDQHSSVNASPQPHLSLDRGRASSDEYGSGGSGSPRRHRLSLFRRSRSPSESSVAATSPSPSRVRGERRLSQLLHLDRGSRESSRSSVNIPADLPQISDKDDDQDREAQWEKRATLLVQGNSASFESGTEGRGRDRSRSSSPTGVNNPEGDTNIQEAIRRHEAGDLVTSTKMFGRLADPNGANNALSQVLYGLALRHGWGCSVNPTVAVSYLTAAASNSASIESEALRAGLKKGGAAKGELVLAIYELANCFRNAWGVDKDPAAARQYYETAANLGDADAMNEIAWCYLEGFGGKKDKFAAAKYYRLAEENGNKTVGNSWIWKDKYNPVSK